MSQPRLYLLIVVALTLAIPVLGVNTLRLCVVESIYTGHYIDNNCKKIEKHGFECVVVSDRITCSRALTEGKVDFAVLEPEELFASHNHGIANFLITHELRLFPNDSSNYQMVVLVSKNIRRMADLRGKKLCHPGFDPMDTDWTPLFINHFQNQIIPKRCSLSETLLENRIAGLSENFEMACISGVWTADTAMESILKTKYRNLCALCDNPHCYNDDKYHGREGVLLCLTENLGDIAWSRLADAREYFKSREDQSEYSFLCPDGMPRSLDWSSPCSWITRPWPVVAARSDIAERIATVIDTLKQPAAEWQTMLLQLLENWKASPVRVDTLKPPEDYLHQFIGLSSAYARATCSPSRVIKWCVSSNIEHRKCQWLNQVANSYTIEPSVSCILLESRKAALRALSKQFCDLYVADSEEIMDAQKQNLTVAFELSAPLGKDFNNIAIFVKAESSYTNLKDLKGARACFPKFRSVGWNAFVAVMRNQTNDTIWRCSDEKAMSSFFSSIIYPKDGTPDRNLISSTYDCLMSGEGDVAVVSVTKSYQNNSKLNRICVDNTASTTGRKANECILTWTTLGSILVHKNLPILRRDEIKTFLQEMNTWFGVRYPPPTPSMSLFAAYDGEKDVIFSSTTVNFIEDISGIELPRAYPNILYELQVNDSQSTEICAGASSYRDNGLIIFFITALLLKSQM